MDLTGIDEDELINEADRRKKFKEINAKKKMAVTSSNKALRPLKQVEKLRDKISQTTKLKVLDLVEKNLTYTKIAEQLNLKSMNTVKTIVANKTKILSNSSNANEDTFRIHKGKLPILEKILVQWIAIQRAKHPPLPITYELVQLKANEFRNYILEYFPTTTEYKQKEEAYKLTDQIKEESQQYYVAMLTDQIN
jgi:hypothetical protein